MNMQVKALFAFLMLLASVERAWALDADSTVITGVNVAGAVRVNNLACLEALLNIGANGIEILGITITVVVMIRIMTKKPGTGGRRKAITLAMLPAACGLCAPSAINLMVTIARDANLFS